ncbi:hypothetical protein RD055328_02090 [Companilactobacillus sp. RD055328]|uniref:FtsB family cell division protein n=1 Tax=Companilactobacillus sp. RD055328 TaxID=2916634 RepID=UPI001FC801B2|nr:septum formation initiator family protein [Companilactobacillus sp. RD055328]GKQ42286.1 hypothetical protein RD055328_02090 [Companilactobacillus sp. RD055328]
MNNDDNKNIITFKRRMDKKQHAELSHEDIIHRRRLIAIISALVLVILFFGFQIIRSKISDAQTQKSIVTSQQKLKKEKSTNKELKLKAKQLQDQDYIEKVIRSKYYYSKEGEQVYALPGSDDITNGN